jgi:hypothetical protein
MGEREGFTPAGRGKNWAVGKWIRFVSKEIVDASCDQ